ncbi:MAG: thiamine phosphate synthase [Prosthecochloris sp.]|nr:thiamine phosphate synthase [Prosthecochloris sp.]
MIEHYTLCFITSENGNPVEEAEAALQGGAGMIQLRRKNASGRELFELSTALIQRCHAHNALLIVNDRLDIALASGADGVHVGQDDLPVTTARQLLPPGRIVGCSAYSIDEAVSAERDGADYIGAGHIFETGSKEKHDPPLGPPAIARFKEAVSIPIIAIGGITENNAPEIIRHGADGIAVISAIAASSDPRHAAQRLMNLFTTDTNRS